MKQVNQYQPVRDTAGNRYTGTESGNMNNDELIKFIEDYQLIKIIIWFS